MEFVWKSSGVQSRKRTTQDKIPRNTLNKRLVEKSEKLDRNSGVEDKERLAGDPHSELNTRESSLEPSRVTVYNPEYVLSDLSKSSEFASRLGQTQTGPTHSSPPHTPVQETRPTSSQIKKEQRQLHWYKRIKKRAAPSTLSDPHQRYLEDVGAFLELPPATTDALLPIYVSVFDDLIPIVDGACAFRDYSNKQSSSYLVKAICLVTCKTTQAAPFLRISSDGPTLNPLEFASKLLPGLEAAIKADLEPDRIIKVQVLALMHLQTDGLSGMDRALSHLSQAICEAWSLSLHLKIPGNPEQDQNDLLWWTLRNFDRINKPITGAAPFIIDDTDIGIERITTRRDSYRSQIMEVSLRLGDLMVIATKVHKASSKARVDQCHEFPSLSELTSGTDYDRFHKSHRAYLEVWYLVAAMLSCRYSGPGSVQYNRRLTSAYRIVDLISCGKEKSIPPLPLIPYATSMSLTIIYRALRDNQRNNHTAYEGLLLCCNALDAMTERWTSTKRMVQLAKQLLKLLNKPGVMNSHPDNMDDGPRQECRARPSAVTAADNPLKMRRQRENRYASIEQLAKSPTGACQTHEAMQSDHAAHIDENSPQYWTELWPEIDASYFQLDSAIYDLFDDSLPIASQDPAAWNYVRFAMNENSYASNDSQFTANFTSPDLEYSNECLHEHDH